MKYYEVNLKVNSEFTEIMLAELADIGYDSFLETEEGLQAYIEEDLYDPEALEQVIDDYKELTSLTYTIQSIHQQNWNKEWESNFSPIDINGKVYVRATFHDPAPESYLQEIIIVPKMSFGTGHHETTEQMIALQMDIDHKGKSVLDVGTGTGILAIMAHKLGAKRIHAFDIDEWSVENGMENFQLNGITDITIEQATIEDQGEETYDIVLANINRNVLLAEIPKYVHLTNEYLIVSGFYTKDVADIEAVAKPSGLKKVKLISKNDWTAVVFKK